MNISKFIEASPVFSIIKAHSEIERSISRILGERISFLEALVMAAIFFEEKKYAYPSHLAIALSTSTSNISHSISDLEYYKLVRREVCETDARRFRVYLTDKGKRHVHRLIQYLDTMQKNVERSLGEAPTTKLIHQISKICEIHRHAQIKSKNRTSA